MAKDLQKNFPLQILFSFAENRRGTGTAREKLPKVREKTRIGIKMGCQKKDAKYLAKELICLFYLSETLIVHCQDISCFDLRSY